ncbi:hypothetical protein [Empedobacter falsenii]|uniref:DUF2158 domain-containing protein n=1 Tax=Empedobacter falsenii TaxID=343874 RepID=A0AAW7DJ87_9FLAO|nr:hypothetical protein [Empedobacter falsenii]MDM1551541.1 hypothetical protein [Empedobacter falsenii]
MSETKIKVGSIVCLNSDQTDNPDLFTVGSIEYGTHDTNIAVVYWFDSNTKDLKSFKVHVGALTVLE